MAALTVKANATNATANATDVAAGVANTVFKRGGSNTLLFGTVDTAEITNNAVSNAKLATMTALTVKANATNATAVPTDVAAGVANTVFKRGGANTLLFGTVDTAEITNNAVDNTKLAQVPTATFKSRLTAGTGNSEDLTVTQAKTLLAITQSDVSGLIASLSSKQDTLVSGTNIRTVNGQTLLGSTDLVISAGGGNAFTSFSGDITFESNKTYFTKTVPTSLAVPAKSLTGAVEGN
jgi:hypothetical protein